MGIFNKISSDAFSGFQVGAGMLLNSFDPVHPVEPADEDIVTATTGGITVTCEPTYSDFGEDVDNCPNNTMELKRLDGWECSLSTTALEATPASIRLSLGAADIDTEDETKIVPRSELELGDFSDLWWVGEKVGGGLLAVQIKNALSSGGFSIKTQKNGKGNLDLAITGHVSISNLSEVPMVFYSTEGE